MWNGHQDKITDENTRTLSKLSKILMRKWPQTSKNAGDNICAIRPLPLVQVTDVCVVLVFLHSSPSMYTCLASSHSEFSCLSTCQEQGSSFLPPSHGQISLGSSHHSRKPQGHLRLFSVLAPQRWMSSHWSRDSKSDSLRLTFSFYQCESANV